MATTEIQTLIDSKINDLKNNVKIKKSTISGKDYLVYQDKFKIDTINTFICLLNSFPLLQL